MLTSTNVILFDLGDVACRFLPDRRLCALTALSDIEADQLQNALRSTGIVGQADHGTFTSDEMVDKLSDILGLSLSTRDAHHAWSQAFDPDPEVIALARELRSSHTVGLLTNNPPLLYDALPDHLPNIAETFDPILFSFAFRAVKPDPDLYDAVTAHLDVPPEEILLIDDSTPNVAAA